METKILVPDMHCGHCVNRINNALNAEGVNFSVSLEDKTVTVNGCEHCLNKAKQTLEDLGFTPELV